MAGRTSRGRLVAGPRRGEPVVGVGPGSGLVRVQPGTADPLGEQCELVPAALPD